jgi:hypothetical protein
VALLRARAEAARLRLRFSEAAQLNDKADAVLAARAAGQSLWDSELSPLVLQKVLELLQWEPVVCREMRATCSTWCSILDSLLPGPTWVWSHVGDGGQAGVVPERHGGGPDAREL